ncbi:MAG: HDOD domain-containing protein [Burkholderiaceae bacterium]|nr:HDOD domain-containing protein [Burkholderiaceae bacterium]
MNAPEAKVITMTEVLKSIRDLPALPIIVIELMGTLDQEDAGAGMLAEKLSRDQALSAKVLRLSNSSFYGLSSKVTTIQQAIAILGFNSVRTLVTTASVLDTFASSEHVTFNFKGFWRHSIATALCAKTLARHLRLNQDQAFIIGLLHDIGRLVLVTGSPEHYASVVSYREQNDCYLIEAESATLGLDHTMVGSALAAHWKFPVLIQKAIANHHAPNAADPASLSPIVHMADCMAHALGLSDDESDLVSPVLLPVWSSMSLDQEALDRIFRDIEMQFEEANKILMQA